MKSKTRHLASWFGQPARPAQRRWLSACLVLGAILAPAQAADEPVSFSRDIRPLLSDRCFVCHGPDVSLREADLRLDTFELATQERKAGAPIVAGQPAASLLYQRVSALDLDDRMPPEGSHKAALDAREQELIRRWIEAGAKYENHWAFEAPCKPAIALEGRNPIDVFIHQRLAEEDLAASPPVAPELALRRLFLDVTGLPASPAETDAFLSETAAGDPQQVWLAWIDKLFNEEPYRSRYAERMTSPWLDQARYADTSGIHMDAGRQIWPWRDWVLAAYRDNMPFDQFLTEQLAGDLIPDATVAQKIASGFNRNHVTTDEGGAIDAEYLVEYAADRAETTSEVWLGLTLGCARCHDHKFDPVTQSDYYSMFAFFASNAEPGLYSQVPDANRALEPFLEVPSAEQAAEREALALDLEELQTALADPSAEERQALVEFRQNYPANQGLEWADTEVTQMHSEGGATLTLTPDGTILASGVNPERDTHTIHLQTQARNLRLVQLDVLGHESFTNGAPGRAENGNAVLTGVHLEAVSLRDPQERQSLQISWLWADAAQDNDDWSLQRALDERPNTGWAIAGHTDGAERVALLLTSEPFGYEGGSELIVKLEYDSIYANHAFGHVRLGVASLSEPGVCALPLAQGHWYYAGPFSLESAEGAYEKTFGPELAAGFDLAQEFEIEGGERVRWQFRSDFKDGQVNALPGGVNIHYLAREIYSPDKRQVEISLGSDDGFELFVNGEQVAAREIPRGVAPDQDSVSFELQAGRNSFLFKVINTGGQSGFYYRALEKDLGLDTDLVAVLADTSARADQGQALTERVTHAWRLSRSAGYRLGQEQISALELQQAELEMHIPRTMVMHELEQKRPIYVLKRGQYDKPDMQRLVQPAIPSMFGKLPLEPTPDGERRATRLDLAHWMTSSENPLVARVAVNRLWQMVFGTGIVSTSGDFGYQGAWPSHPQLLDWLAVEFVESGWDTQHLLRFILASETYRQSSEVLPEALERDPNNRWLSHFPRRRLDAERLRDSALYISGLLSETLGGPSVKPYQPAALWREVAMPQSNTRIFERGEGNDLWRRSLYTYWKRACPPPSLITFDAPTREACVTQRSITNTPLQALVLWNDEQYLEAARVLAERTLADQPAPAQGIKLMFRRCTGRFPSAHELELLLAALDDHLTRYQANPEEASALTMIGEKPRLKGIDDSQLAAWTLLANALFNLHATITQG